MSSQPNILFLMTDQMQGQTLRPDHPCITPNLDKLAARGIRCDRAYTPNAVCSPARASLMTGLLPHNHGVLMVTHTTDDDQSSLRTEYPHWAQHLQAAGYRTGYFGKWHVERTNDLEHFGWQVNGAAGTAYYNEKRKALGGERHPAGNYSLRWDHDAPSGYHSSILYGVTDVPVEKRMLGITTEMGLDFLGEATLQDDPWCCFVSVIEPHDPFIAGAEAFAQYAVEDIPLCPNVHDALEGRPGLYRKTARVWNSMSARQKQEAAACYYGMITEIDRQFGRLIDKVEAAGQLDDTIVVFTNDHGELLGSHGMYCKNISGYEEVYNIPLVVAGSGIAPGAVSRARIGLHDLGPTLLELTNCAQIDHPDSRSHAAVFQHPQENDTHFQTGFGEYFGGRIYLTQRVMYHNNWKLLFNGFDIDELYNLEDDPHEMNNLAENPACDDQLRHMFTLLWERVKTTGDHSLFNSHYPALRLASYGPNILGA